VVQVVAARRNWRSPPSRRLDVKPPTRGRAEAQMPDVNVNCMLAFVSGYDISAIGHPRLTKTRARHRRER
jgi:hypothetical protein